MSDDSARRPSMPRRSSMSVFAPTPPSMVSAPAPIERSQSRVRFDNNGPQNPSMTPNPFSVQEDHAQYIIPLDPSAPVGCRAAAPEWHMPVYSVPNANPASRQVYRNDGADIESVEEFPMRRVSRQQLAVGPFDDRRGSAESDRTLKGEEEQYKKYSLSSYQHPYDIPAPANAYSGRVPPSGPRSRPGHTAMQPTVSFAGAEGRDEQYHDNYDDIEDGQDARATRQHNRRGGILTNLIELYGINHSSGRYHDDEASMSRRPTASRRPSEAYSDYSMGYSGGGPGRNVRRDSNGSIGSQMLDPDDPRVTGMHKEFLEDPEERKREAMRMMDYRQRRKERAKVKIEFNITSVLNRQLFLLKLARALMTFGAPSHRIESQLVAAARILEVEAEFIHLPSVIIVSFNDEGTKTSETHFVKCGGRLSLGSLHQVHNVYRSVVHDEISAKRATMDLQNLLRAKPLYPTLFRCFLAFFLSALICPLAFGGSFLDMWISGAGAFILCLLQLCVATKSAMYANVFEITIAIFMSFSARGLSSIRSQIFCYTAISSAGIVGILPGYLILTSSLELASKNIVCGSVKMVYALIYTLFLGFGLQIGSDLYLLFDHSSRHDLQALAAHLSKTTVLLGSFALDNSTVANSTRAMNPLPVSGTFTFTDSTPLSHQHIVEGCYRPESFPWYLQPFPFWTQFLIVPMFSIISSLANLQPWFSWDLVVMVVISCASYTSNKVANHYIFDRSDIVSAIGAFTVGILGNVYSRKFGGTAFTSMVTGVLFLVPSGLSQAGGITANGNGIDIGGAMIAVTIGITVGLFMSQAFVYTFGSRKNAAVFSF